MAFLHLMSPNCAKKSRKLVAIIAIVILASINIYIYIYITKISLNFHEYSNENVKTDDGLNGDSYLEGGNIFNRNHHHEHLTGKKAIQITNYYSLLHECNYWRFDNQRHLNRNAEY